MSNHPDILKLIDWGEAEGRTYLVLEYVEGRSLRDFTPEELPRDRILAILLQLCDAVACAHAAGIVHRDLKPENVMLTPRGRIKVMDFGLARSEDAQRVTRTGTALGTPAYMAPEQIRSLELDPRTDQYAIGVIAYELLTGRLPFRSQDSVQLIFQQLTETPVPPSDVAAEITPALSEVLMRMLAKQPEERFPTLGEARQALAEAGGVAEAGPVDVPYSLSRRPQCP